MRTDMLSMMNLLRVTACSVNLTLSQDIIDIAIDAAGDLYARSLHFRARPRPRRRVRALGQD